MGLLISKSISQLLLPPGSLILLALLGLAFWQKRWGRGLVLVSMALLWLLSTEPLRDALVGPLENQYPALQVNTLPAGDMAIVLLGGGLYEKAPEFEGRDSLGMHALMRTVYAADLATRIGVPVYPTGGAVLSNTTEPEGAVMRRWLIKLGVPASMVHAEISANNTWENAAHIKAMVNKQGIRHLLLVTSANHMPRSVWTFKQHGLQVIPAPCAYIAERESYDVRSFLPRWNVLADSGDALHEYLGILWYKARYSYVDK